MILSICILRRFFAAFAVLLFISSLALASHKENSRSWNVFPILMYDSDIGVGYGAKGKILNFLGKKESFDLILFNSTKGERWYVFTFSIPDFEVRQGDKYGFSFDLRAEYDKYLKYYFYGIGQNSEIEDETSLVYERKELQIVLGRALSRRLIIELGYVFREVAFSSVEEDKAHTEYLEDVGSRFSPFGFVSIRYDTTDSRIHPRKGIRLFLKNDTAGSILGNKYASYNRMTLDARAYHRLFGRNDIIAIRMLLQSIFGDSIPVFEYPDLGGGSEFSALRGYRLNRYLDKGKLLVNIEYRFPIWKKFGGNLFIDTGGVGSSISGIDIGRLRWDAGWGLRYYLENFLVRFDMGFSSEGTRIFFNFGHVF